MHAAPPAIALDLDVAYITREETLALRSFRSQTPGAQLHALTTRHSVWNACAHGLGPHVPSLEGCEGKSVQGNGAYAPVGRAS